MVIQMKVYKEKQYLIFELDNGKCCKYDFARKTAIGFKGQPVKDLKRQLKGLTMHQIIECCTDKKYAAFLKFVQQRNPTCMSNIGTILSKVPYYSRYEQIFSAGFEDIIDSTFSRTINDIPKALIKVAQQRKVKISNKLCDFWTVNPNAYYLAYNLKYISLDDKDINDILTTCKANYFDGIGFKYYSYFNQLIDNFGYSAKALLLYIDELKTFEALDNIRSLMKEIYDYANMMSSISNKYDKYPRHFLSTHKIACRNYDRLKKEFSEDLFKKRIKKSFECTYGDYIFVYPNSTQDIKDEASMQSNCVASYIDRVLDGSCHIMFLRKKKNPEKSLVTIEISNNKIVQAKRKYNSEITDEDKKAIEYWNNKYKGKEEKIA